MTLLQSSCYLLLTLVKKSLGVEVLGYWGIGVPQHPISPIPHYRVTSVASIVLGNKVKLIYQSQAIYTNFSITCHIA